MVKKLESFIVGKNVYNSKYKSKYKLLNTFT